MRLMFTFPVYKTKFQAVGSIYYKKSFLLDVPQHLWFDECISVSENSRVPLWACGAAGSALPWHGRGRRFDPDQVHQLTFLESVFLAVAQQSQRSKLGLAETSVSFAERLPINKCPEPARARRVTQFPQRLYFNLADAFTRYLEVLSYFFQRMLRPIFQPESHFDDALFPWVECAQHVGSLLLQIHADHGLSRRNAGRVLNEIAGVNLLLRPLGSQVR